MSLRPATDLVTGAIRLRLAAHSLATLPVRPIEAWPPAGRDGAAAAAGGLRQACCRSRPGTKASPRCPAVAQPRPRPSTTTTVPCMTS